MPAATLGCAVIRFGPFELDPNSGELRKKGVRLKLQGQPLQVLCLLLERPGELVTREELRAKLWPADTFVAFDVGLNTAIMKVRAALDDSADTPSFVETVPRRGYRFIYPLNGPAVAAPPAPRRRWPLLLLLAVPVVLFGIVLTTNVGRLRERLFGPRPIKAIAVLPLRAESPEQADLADRFTEMLITKLGTFSDLEVPSHQSVRQFANSTKAAPEIAEQLKVDALVEGTVLQAGNRVGVTVNVIDVRMNHERHWISEAFERDLGDLFRLQEDVAEIVAQRIRSRLPAEQSCPSARAVAPEVMATYLQGLAYLKNGIDDDRDKAADLFLKAIEADAEFAPGYAALALLYSHGGAGRQGGSGPNRANTRVWAEKAIQLDPCQAEAHTALAWSELSDRKWLKAEGEFQRAIQLNPNFPRARTWYGEFLVAMGRPAEAIAQADVVLRLDVEKNNVTHAAWVLGAAGRVDDEIRHLHSVLQRAPDYLWAHEFLAEAYVEKHMYREAVAELEEAARLSQPDIHPLGMLAYAYAQNGQRAEAEKLARDLDARARKAIAEGNWIGPVVMVPAYLALGDKDKAMTYLERTNDERHAPGMAFLNVTDAFRPLHSEARFQDLLRRVLLPR